MSGSRESNPDHTVPNRVHYHYATPRGSEGRGVLGQQNNEQKIKDFFYFLLIILLVQAKLAADRDRTTRGCKLRLQPST